MSFEIAMHTLDIIGSAFGMIFTALACFSSLKGKRNDAIFWLLWATFMAVTSQI